jgi:hypothetical protein
MRNYLLLFSLMIVCALGCSREKTRVSLFTQPAGHPVAPLTELPVEENAYHLWTNAMLYAQPPKNDETLGAAFRAASSFKTNYTVTTEWRSPGGERRASPTHSNLTTIADCPALLEWLKSQKPVLEQIDKGLSLGKIQYPPTSMSNAMETLHMTGFISLVSLKKVYGRYLAECGDYSGAINQFCDIYKMGDMAASGHRTILACLIRNGLCSSGYVTGIEWLIRQHTDDVTLLREILNRMPPPATGDLALNYTCRTEASLYTLDAFKQIAGQKIYYNKFYPSRLYSLLDPEKTTTLIQAFYAQAATNACKPWTAKDLTITDEVSRRLTGAGLPVKLGANWSVPIAYTQPILMKDEETISVWKRLKQCARSEPNIYGLLFLYQIMGPVNSAHERSVKVRCQIILLRAAIALMIIKAETGSYPDTLDETVKKGLLPELPVDFFTGKPLLYSHEHKCIWSTGSDGINNGGESKTDVIFLLP